jgi:hypothetical protein
MLLLVAPAEEKDREKAVRKISDVVSGDPMATETLVPLTPGDKLALYLFRLGKIVYANNLTGSDFKSIIRSKGKLMPINSM